MRHFSNSLTFKPVVKHQYFIGRQHSSVELKWKIFSCGKQGDASAAIAKECHLHDTPASRLTEGDLLE